ncbi:F0F1 ATP synthase subunit epsilon [Desulfohalobiaceae bacterium Ax17]|jgi:F-type H+-transporting ATPase subunit epsilon|uniref:F0F1 ATP synthase subunit epsilon n=1 Tax=Desulfovulcanus ferrireducens TaxID=2831190 RepID=UPI00207BB23F|nr:F0F1 ATP synthase subunit epsilon [Desulfovulcanus ferrireducens]MBT8763283.1 F0F1 ATP synthase subunit epsilon [Desulfovulcanus ferrireducens]
MANSIKLEIVTPDRKLLSEEVEYVGAPGINGEFGVLPNHIPFLSALGIGSLYYKKNGRNYYVFVAGGFAEVTPTKVSVLAEIAEKAEEIDVERARKARERAEMRLREQKDREAYARAKASLARALHRMKCRECAEEAGTCM